MWPTRVAVSGNEFSPGFFEICAALGKEETLNRLQKSIDKLN
jgi:glutamyl/glutaminyl-tRNA synthetase